MAKLWTAFVVLIGIAFLVGMFFTMKRQAGYDAHKAHQKLVEDSIKAEKENRLHFTNDSLKKVLVDSLKAIQNK